MKITTTSRQVAIYLITTQDESSNFLPGETIVEFMVELPEGSENPLKHRWTDPITGQVYGKEAFAVVRGGQVVVFAKNRPLIDWRRHAEELTDVLKQNAELAAIRERRTQAGG